MPLLHREGVGVGVVKVSLVEVQLVVHEGLEVLTVSLEVNLSREPEKRKKMVVKMTFEKLIRTHETNDVIKRCQKLLSNSFFS